MDNKIKNKVNTLVKSMCKSAKRVSAKDVIADVMDSDRTAEMSSDDIPKARIGALNKAKDKAKKKAKEDKEDIDYECGGGPVEKGEKFVKDFMAGFEKISKAYLMEKAKIDDLEPSATKRREARKIRGHASNVKTGKKRVQMRDESGQPTEIMANPRKQVDLKGKLKDKQQKRNSEKGIAVQPSKKDLEYPTAMAASEDS